MDTNTITVISGFIALVFGGLLYTFVAVSPQLPVLELIIMEGSSTLLMLVGIIAILKLFW